MKHLLSLFLISLFLVQGCESSSAKNNNETSNAVAKKVADKKGIKAPDFTLADLNGNWVSLSDFKGKVIMLNFWGTWCGPCRKEIPDFVKMMDKHQKEGLEIVGITLSSGTPEKIQSFSDQWGINYTLLTDIEGNETQMVTSQFGKATGKPITGIPTTFIIDRDGYIQKTYVGPRTEAVFMKDLQPYL